MYTFQIFHDGKTINLTVMQDRYESGALRLAMFTKDTGAGSMFFGDITKKNSMLDSEHGFVLEGDRDLLEVMDIMRRLGIATPTPKIGKSKDGTKKYRVWYFHQNKLERYCSKSRTLQMEELKSSIDIQLRVLKDMGKYSSKETGILIRKKLYATCNSSLQVEAAVYNMKYSTETVAQFLGKEGGQYV